MTLLSRYSLLLLLTAGLGVALADTPPPTAVKLRGGTDGAIIGNIGDQLKVVIPSPIPIFAPSSIPVSIPSPLPIIGVVDVANFPSPTPTQTITGVVNQGIPAATSSAWPMILCNSSGANCVAVNVDGSVNADVSGAVTCNAGTGSFTVVQSIGSNLHVNIDALPAVAQGAPGPTSSPWPVVLVSSIPLVVSVPSPLPISGSVNVLNFPSPVPTQIVSGEVIADQGAPAPAASAWPVYLPSPIPSQTVTVANFPQPSPTITVAGTVTANQGAPGPGASPWPVYMPSPIPNQAVNQGIPAPASSPWPVYLPSPIPSQSVSVIAEVTPADKPASGSINVHCTSPTGTCAAGSFVQIPNTNGISTATVQVTGTFSATLDVQCSTDNSTWVLSSEIQEQGAGENAIQSTITAPGTYKVLRVASCVSLRIIAGVYTSGTASVIWNSSAAPGLTEVFQQNPNNLSANVYASNGTAFGTDGTGAYVNLEATSFGGSLSSFGIGQPSNAFQIGGWYGAGSQFLGLSVDASGNLNVNTVSSPTDIAQVTTTNAQINIQDTASVVTTGANSQSFITGTPTVGSAAVYAFNSATSIEVQVLGDPSFTGTLQTEISMDRGTTWYTRGVKQAGVSNISSSFIAPFAGGMNVSGMSMFRVRSTAAMTGTAIVTVTSTVNPGSITVSNPIILRDSTTQSVTSTIKAAGIPAATGDTALVVSVSPNSIVTSMVSDLAANGSLTGTCSTPSSACPAGSFISLQIMGVASAQVQVSGTFTGTSLNVDGSADGGTTWSTLGTASGFSGANSLYSTTAFTASGKYRVFRIAGLNQLRVRQSALATGSVSINLTASIGSNLNEGVQLNQDNLLARSFTGGLSPTIVPFTQSYSSSNLSASAFTTIISATTATINSIDIFDNSGGLWYLAYASTCGGLSASTAGQVIIVGPGGGGKDFLIPSGNCVGFEAIGSTISSGNVYMTFYK